MVNVSNKLIKLSYCSIDFATITILHNYMYAITSTAKVKYSLHNLKDYSYKREVIVIFHTCYAVANKGGDLC